MTLYYCPLMAKTEQWDSSTESNNNKIKSAQGICFLKEKRLMIVTNESGVEPKMGKLNEESKSTNHEWKDEDKVTFGYSLNQWMSMYSCQSL